MKLILAAAGLATALSLGGVGCAAQQQRNQENVHCKNAVTTGSHIARPICRTVSKEEQKRMQDREALRRAQQRDRMDNPDQRPQNPK
jgi:hypothetical protein